MVYPKEPVYNCETAYEQCLAYYLEHIDKYDCGKIIFMGVLAITDCPNCKRNLTTGKKSKKNK